jgi:hypothetical protein
MSGCTFPDCYCGPSAESVCGDPDGVMRTLGKRIVAERCVREDGAVFFNAYDPNGYKGVGMLSGLGATASEAIADYGARLAKAGQP